jgi:hypothetical protein
MCTGEVTFHIHYVNRHIYCVWGQKGPHKLYKHVKDPKFNMWCGMVNNPVTGTLFFAENFITANSYPDMSQFFVFPQTAK